MHAQLQHQTTNDEFSCQRCGQEFEYRILLEQHIQEDHQSGSDMQVGELLKQVDLEVQRSEQSLKRSGLKNECNVCGKLFRKPCLLARHAVVHSREKKFQCPMCPKTFTQKSSLQRHSQHNHKGVKAHQCSKCTISFSQKTNLLSHLKSAHPLSSTTRYACDRCACAYSKLNTLMRHKKQQHHGDNSESVRVARLAVSFQDDTPVDDADELARNVLNELRKLQGGMLIASENLCTEREKLDKTPCETSTPTTETIVDTSQTDLIDLVDKLNPQQEPRVITVQCIRRSNGIAYYICEFCAKEFKKTYDLIRHRRTHLLELPYKCEHCNKMCITKSKLEQHKKKHTTSTRLFGAKANNIYVCSICQKVLNSMRQFDAHIDSHSQTHTLLCNCSICGRSFGTLTAFSKHKHEKYDKEFEMLSYLLPSPIYISPTLNDPGISSSFKVNETNVRSKEEQEVPKCSSCERLFSSERNLQLHQKIHVTHKQFSCSQCVEKWFPTYSRLRRHMLTHNQQRNFKCVYCTKTFKSKEHCKQHMKFHLKALLKDNVENANSNFEDIKKCEIAVQENALLLPPQASTPEKQMTSPPKFIELQMLPNYRKHRKLKNITVNTLPSSTSNFTAYDVIATNCCSFCQRRFKKPSDLQRHLRTHTKERPFACDRCSKSFALQSTLKDHQQTHSQLRITHACQVCGISYASKKVLLLHLRLHTGERPFICEHCDQTFRTSGHCKAHIKAMHKQK